MGYLCEKHGCMKGAQAVACALPQTPRQRVVCRLVRRLDGAYGNVTPGKTGGGRDLAVTRWGLATTKKPPNTEIAASWGHPGARNTHPVGKPLPISMPQNTNAPGPSVPPHVHASCNACCIAASQASRAGACTLTSRFGMASDPQATGGSACTLTPCTPAASWPGTHAVIMSRCVAAWLKHVPCLCVTVPCFFPCL